VTPLKLALLGTGRIADMRLAPALTQSRSARLWSVLSRDPGRAADFAHRHDAGAPGPAHSDLEDLLADSELDGVVIATPDGLHAAHALAAIRAGKHVLVEKPMATSGTDAAAMVAAAEAADVRLGVAYHLRWHAGHRAMSDAVRAGAIGEPRHVRAQWAWPAEDDSNWRAHGEVGRWWSLAGVGTHCLDLIRWLMIPSCGEVEEVRGVASRSVWQGPHDETAVVALKFASGATAQFTSSVQFASPSQIHVYGSDGYFLGTDTLGPLGGGTITSADGPLDFDVANPFVGEIDDFADAVREGRAPEVDGAEGLRNVEILEEFSAVAGL
jgi:1,5-anhydro-D-fructose reductase (1,5-anhydro-D-mannitol-forming)